MISTFEIILLHTGSYAPYGLNKIIMNIRVSVTDIVYVLKPKNNLLVLDLFGNYSGSLVIIVFL
jgi:hypothetical protein